MLERPADEGKDRVDGRFRRDMGVGIQAVQDAEPSESKVSEHILGDQRRSEQQRQLGKPDRQTDG